MAEEKTIEIKGLAEIQEALEKFPETIMPACEQAMSKAVDAIAGFLVPYPPETAANQPGRMGRGGKPMPYYERNRGTWWPSKPKAGAPKRSQKSHGIIIPSAKNRAAWGVAMYVLSPTSEQLGKKWTSKVTRGRGEITGEISNSASYALDVEGPKGDQLPLFAKIGWPNADEAVEKSTPDIEAAFKDALDAIHL